VNLIKIIFSKAKKAAIDRSKDRADILKHYSSATDKPSSENKDKDSSENKDSNELTGITASAESKELKDNKDTSQPTRSDIINELRKVVCQFN